MADDLSKVLREKIAAIWKQSIPLIADRLRVIDDCSVALTKGALTESQRHVGSGEAHKLAGSLGMFGYNAASALARELELQFESAKPDAPVVASLAARLRAALPLNK